MRYIGGKKDLLNNIGNIIEMLKAHTVIDVFAGSGAVSSYLDQKGYVVLSNDILYFAYIINRSRLTLSKTPDYKNLPIRDPISYLNDLTLENSDISIEECFIRNNYSKHSGCDRMYLQEKNAIKIDLIRITIEKWHNSNYISDDEYIYLLSRLIHAVPFVSNITGVYGAYLKEWDKRSYKELLLIDDVLFSRHHTQNKAFNQTFEDILYQERADLLYADPPYNTRQYLPNYHLLETIARYDYPVIKGVTGMRVYDDSDKSAFCSKTNVVNAFKKLIDTAQTEHVVISYNTEGIMPYEELAELCIDSSRPNTFKLTRIPYRRYKSHSGENIQVDELIYSFSK